MRTLSSELAAAIANDDGIRPALKATVYKSRNFFEVSDIDDTNEASFGQGSGIQTNPLPQDLHYAAGVDDLFTVYSHNGNIKLTSGSNADFTPTYSGSPLESSGSSRPSIITSGSTAYIYFFDVDGGVWRATADAALISDGTEACISSVVEIANTTGGTSGSLGAVHAMDVDDIAVLAVDDGGVAISRVYYDSGWQITTCVRRFVYPTHVYMADEDTAGLNFSAAVKHPVDDEWLVYLSMPNGAVHGIVLSDDGTWGDIWEVIPSDISTFKVANADIAPNGMIHLAGQFQRVDLVERSENDVLLSVDERLADSTSYFTSDVVHCLDLWSERGRTFSLDRFTMFTTEDVALGGSALSLRYMTAYRTSGSGPYTGDDRVIYSDANRVLQADAIYAISDEDAESLDIPLGDITSISGSPTSGWNIVVKNSDEKYTNEALFVKNSRIIIEVGAMLENDYEYVDLDNCIIATVDRTFADGKRTLTIKALSTTLWKVSVMTHPFYMEFQSKQSIYLNDLGNDDQWGQLSEASSGGKLPFDFVVDFWNNDMFKPQTHEDVTESDHETFDLKELGLADYPVIQQLPMTVKLYGWSRAGKETCNDPSSGDFPGGEGSSTGNNDEFTAKITVIHPDEEEETEIELTTLTSTYANPEQTWEATRSGDYPVEYEMAASDGFEIGDEVIKVTFTVTSDATVDETTYVVERMEIPDLTMWIPVYGEEWSDQVEQTTQEETEYGTEYSYDGNMSFDSSYGDVVRTGKPLEDPTGRDCDDDNDCLWIQDDSGGAWAVYDLGRKWFNIDRIQVRKLHDGDWWCGVSEDGVTWYETYVHRLTWAAASCDTLTYSQGDFSTPSGWDGTARYIRFRVAGIALVGDHAIVAWFNVRGNPAPQQETPYGRTLLRAGIPVIMFAEKPFRAFNFQAQARFYLSGTGGYGGVVGLASDANNYVVARMSATNVELVKVRDGEEVELDSASIATKTGEEKKILMQHKDGNFKVWVREDDYADITERIWEETPDIWYKWEEGDGQLCMSDDIIHVGVYGLKSVPMLRICSFGVENSELIGVMPLGDDDYADFPSSGQVMLDGITYDYTGKVAPPDPIEGPFQARNTTPGWDYSADGVSFYGTAVEITKFAWIDQSDNDDLFAGKILASSNSYAWLVTITDWKPWIRTVGQKVFLKNRSRHFGNEISGNNVGFKSKMWLTGGLSGVTLPEGEDASGYHDEGTLAYLVSECTVTLQEFAASSGHEDMTVEDMIAKIVQLAGGKAVFPGDVTVTSKLLTSTEWTVA